MAVLGTGTTTSDSTLGPGYPTQGSWNVAIAPITASVTVGITVVPINGQSSNVPGNRVGG